MHSRSEQGKRGVSSKLMPTIFINFKNWLCLEDNLWFTTKKGLSVQTYNEQFFHLITNAQPAYFSH